MKGQVINLEIRTKRLIIKPYQPIYLEDYYREFTEEITKYQYPDSFPDLETAEQVLSGFAREMEAGNMLELAILSQEGEFLGGAEVFGMREDAPELGLWLKSAAQGSGYGYEALGAVLDYLNSLGRYRYYLYEADVRNAPSCRLAEKFRFEAGESQEIATESGKKLTLRAYRIFG